MQTVVNHVALWRKRANRARIGLRFNVSGRWAIGSSVEEKIEKAQRPVRAVKAGQVPDFPWLSAPEDIARRKAAASNKRRPRK